MILRFLRCFAAFRRIEADLAEAQTTVGIERELRLRADAEAQRLYDAYNEAYKGQIEAMKMLANVSVQWHVGCAPPYPETWHLPARKPRPVDYAPIETGRISPTEVMAKQREKFAVDFEEYFSQQNAG